MKRIGVFVIMGGVLLCSVFAAEAQVKPEKGTMLDTTGRFRIEPGFLFGFGFDDVDVGETTDGDKVGLSGGGGAGLEINAGYGINKKLDVDLTFGWQESWLTPEVSNGDGSFERNLFLATLKYKIPISDTQQFKIGLGIGNYSSGEFDVDTSKVTGGAHTIVNYGDSMGFHISGEYEQFFSKDWSWLLGMKYYNVTYDADSVTINGVTYSPNVLADKAKSYDGGGFDFKFSFTRYF